VRQRDDVADGERHEQRHGSETDLSTPSPRLSAAGAIRFFDELPDGINPQRLARDKSPHLQIPASSRRRARSLVSMLPHTSADRIGVNAVPSS